MKQQTQLEKVRNHLKKYKEITSWGAIRRYRITRLSSYINTLRSEGMSIKSENVYPKKGNWYTLYKTK